ncbi:hypothetical protein ACN47E_005692 [Coniothyrium glycines]
MAELMLSAPQEPEPWPLHEDELRYSFIFLAAAKFIEKWQARATVAEGEADDAASRSARKWLWDNSQRRDTIIDNMASAAAAVVNRNWRFQDGYTRPQHIHTIGEIKARFAEIQEQYNQTLDIVPRHVRAPFAKEGDIWEPFSCVAITHTLIGVLQNPTLGPNEISPLIYAKKTKNYMRIMFRTWSGMIKETWIKVFMTNNKDQPSIEKACEDKEDLLDGARQLYVEGIIRKDELWLALSDIHSIQAWFDKARMRGLVGGIQELEARVHKDTDAANERALLPRIDVWLEACMHDRRFRRTALSRAAAFLLHWHQRIPRHNDVFIDANIDLFLAIICMWLTNTNCWEPVFELRHVTRGWEWLVTQIKVNTALSVPFKDRDAATPPIWRIADLDSLASLHVVAAANVHIPPIPAKDASEEQCRPFHGSYVPAFDPQRIPDSTYMGEPIRTSEWSSVMAEMYAGRRLPSLPTSYTFATGPLYDLNQTVRNDAANSYRMLLKKYGQGGLHSFNAITVHIMQKLHDTLAGAEEFDLERFDSLRASLVRLRRTGRLDVTPENSGRNAEDLALLDSLRYGGRGVVPLAAPASAPAPASPTAMSIDVF